MKKVLNLLILSASLVFSSGCILLPSFNSSSDSSSDSSQVTTTQTGGQMTSTCLTTSSTTSTSATTTSQDVNHHCIFHTCGSYLPFTTFGASVSDLASGYQNRDKILAAINQEAGLDIVSSISATNCNISTDLAESVGPEHLHLTIGSGSKEGSIEFTFSKNISKLIVTYTRYYKDPYTVDSEAIIYIDGVQRELKYDSEHIVQESNTLELEFTGNKNSIELHNDDEDQRVFLDSMELFY